MRRAWLGALAITIVTTCPSTHAAPCDTDGLRDPGEECDGLDVGDYRCTDFCYDGGTMRCRSNCTLDFDGCCTCGNNVTESQCNEVCDGSPPPGRTCETEGFSEGGPLGCKASCDQVETNGCYRCGNAIKEGPEECDGSDFGPGGNVCTGPWPEHGGFLSCTPGLLPTPQYADGACHLDRSSCFTCGDGHIEPGEQCDDGNLVPNDGCSDTCTRECGNGSVGRTEGCDDGNQTDGDGCSSNCSIQPTYFGDTAETYDECVLKWGVSAPETTGTQAAVTQAAGGVTVTCADGATTGPNACDHGTTAGSCTFRLFFCMKNNSLGGTCSPRAITRLALLVPTPAGDTLDPADQDAVVTSFGNVMQAIGNATDVAPVSLLAGELQAIAPNVPVNTTGGVAPMCGALSVVVPRPSGTAQKTLRVKLTDTTPRDDVDQITFVCAPP